MNWKSFVLVTVVLCLAFGQVHAQENYNVASINQYYHNWNGRVVDVCISGDYAYVACGDEGLRIVDISEAGSFRDVGCYEIGDTDLDYIFCVAVSGHYAYAATYSDFWVIDISDPAAAQIILNVPVSGTKNALRIMGNYAFVCMWGMSIIDISDPAAAHIVWNSPFSYDIDDIEIHGNTAYAAAGEHGLLVLDISQISSPQILNNFLFSDYSWVGGASIAGNYAFLAAGGRGFQVLDLTSMQIVAGIDSLIYAFRAKVRDNIAYLTYGDPECPLAAIDISNPLSPQTLSIYYPPQDIVNFMLVGDMAFVADYEHGLRVVDISSPQNLHEEYVYNKYGHDSRIAIRDNYAIVKEEYRIATIDISDPTDPYEVSSIDFPQYIRDLNFNGNVGFVCHQSTNCLEAIDYSNPLSPVILGSFIAEDAMPYFAAIYDHYAYILEYSGLRIVDISSPVSMYEVGYFATSVSNCILTIFDHYAVFQNDQRRLIIADLTDPLSPEIVGGYNIGYYEYCNQVTAAEGKLYACTTDKFWIFNISDPGDWTLLSSTDLSDEHHAYLSGFDIVENFAYLTLSARGLCILDIADCSNPQQVGLYQTPGHPNGIDVVGNMAIVADYDNLGFYDCTQAVSVDFPGAPAKPQEFALLPNYPNPFNASTTVQFELPRAGHVSLMVYDILGRSVSTLADCDFQAGLHNICWDGKSSEGKTVASGKYLVRATMGDAAKTIPIMLLK